MQGGRHTLIFMISVEVVCIFQIDCFGVLIDEDQIRNCLHANPLSESDRYSKCQEIRLRS